MESDFVMSLLGRLVEARVRGRNSAGRGRAKPRCWWMSSCSGGDSAKSQRDLWFWMMVFFRVRMRSKPPAVAPSIFCVADRSQGSRVEYLRTWEMEGASVFARREVKV